MQRPVLSKEEIDLLLGGIREGRLPGDDEDEGEPRNAEVYDISGLERVSPARLVGMETINTVICRGIQTSLGAFIGRPVRVDAVDLSVTDCGRFAAGIKADSVICVLTLTPLAGRGLLVIEPQIAGIIVDIFFGGAAASRPSPSLDKRPSPPSPIGRAAIESAARGLVDVIRQGWTDAAAAEFECDRFESNPSSVAGLMGGRNSLVYLSTFRVNIAGGTGVINICLPHVAIEPVRGRLVNTCNEQERKAWSDRLMQRFCDVPLMLSVEMGTALFSARDLLSLKPGDIIEIDRKVMEPLDVLVEGQPVFTASPGAIGSRYAIRLTDVRGVEA